MIPTTRWCTRQPAGSHVHIPAPICLTRPALTISLCEIASASAGGCFSVGSRYSDKRGIVGSEPSRPLDRTAVTKHSSIKPRQGAPMAYSVPPLPYAYDALEPHIDKATMEFHHDKHHQAYVDKANAALEGTEWADKPVEEVLQNLDSLGEKKGPVKNNGGGHYNHSLFWESLSPDGGGEPDGALADAITSAFGSFADFKTKVKETGVGQFGSGWSWLVHDGSGLAVVGSANQDTPLSDGKTPLLGVDVWEHAYYLKYQNRRPDYIDAWWNVVDWGKIAERFSAAG